MVLGGGLNALQLLKVHLVLNPIDELLLQLIDQVLFVLGANSVFKLIEWLDVESLHVGLQHWL